MHQRSISGAVNQFWNIYIMVIVIYENVTAADFRFRSARPPPRHLQIAIWVDESQINGQRIYRIFIIYCVSVCVWTQYINRIRLSFKWSLFHITLGISLTKFLILEQVHWTMNWLTIPNKEAEIESGNLKHVRCFLCLVIVKDVGPNCLVPLFWTTLLVVKLFKAKAFRFNWPLEYHIK